MSFPASPTVGQQVTEGGRQYQWDGYAWSLVANVAGHAATHAAAGADPLTIASSQVTGLPTAGTGSGNYCAGNDSRLSDSRSPTSHAHGNITNAGAIGFTTGQVVVTTTSGVLTTAATISASSQVSGLATVATSGSAADLSGTLADARLSSTVTTALTNARTPTSHASSHATGGSDAITAANIGAAAASHNHAATDITSGTLADARLSSAIATYATLATVANQSSSTLDIFPRGEAGIQTVAPTSGTVWITFFTPATTITVSSITIASGTGTAASGLTLARMGLYTFDETTATLVARTASDTTLFGTTVTSYQRSFSTVGSFPSSYQCVGGTRYGVAVVCVGTTPPTLACRAVNIGIAAMSPRMSAQIASQSDLPTSSTITSSMLNEPFARLS